MQKHIISNKDCLETKYVSGNSDIQQLFREINDSMQAGISINDMHFYEMIRENNWRAVTYNMYLFYFIKLIINEIEYTNKK